VRCGNCGLVGGHNIRSCHEPLKTNRRSYKKKGNVMTVFGPIPYACYFQLFVFVHAFSDFFFQGPFQVT
jgi:hypothetical protein